MLRSLLAPIIPPIALEGVRASLDFYRAFRLRSLLARNEKHLDSAPGSSVFIIANGPSLNRLDLSLLESTQIPAVTSNYFRLHPLCGKLNIVAHCVGEPINSNDPSLVVDCLSGISAHSFWVHWSAKNHIPSYLRDKCYYYMPSSSAAAPRVSRYSLTSSALPYQSTPQMSIAIALYMGYKNIYLIGFDHDWLATRWHSPHFYDTKENSSSDAAPADLSVFSYSQMIRISDNLFRYYSLILEASNALDARIFNATPNSYLDIFPFKVYGECVSEASNKPSRSPY